MSRANYSIFHRCGGCGTVVQVEDRTYDPARERRSNEYRTARQLCGACEQRRRAR